MYLYISRSGGQIVAGREDLLARALSDYGARAGLELRGDEARRLGRGPYGKPFFEGLPSVRFSVAHSGSCWACAMGGEELGLDVEDMSMRRGQDRERAACGGVSGAERYLGIARRFFAADEALYVEGGGRDGAAARFFRVWTRKEAYVKYTGRGLGAGLGGFSVLDGGTGAHFGSIPAGAGLEMACCRARAGAAPRIVLLA
ncbi:MAG: 4'-phosphopantetheinyl transferase superfamily protein [Clostridiales Family XIII bacterium]|jgi:4'-phosphopantetheinyl transferase|nr:4'-phosphopantetheinyl transferase superfamily protein [Clostridiales Family XIII bacterium]